MKTLWLPAFFLGTALACRGAAPKELRPFSTPGFDVARSEERPWNTGDRALYRMSLSNAGDEQLWEVEISVGTGMMVKRMTFSGSTESGPFSYESPMIQGKVLVRNAGEELSQESITGLPYRFLQRGFLELCRMTLDPPAPEATPKFQEEFVFSIAAALSFLQIAQDDPVLSQVFWKVIEKPSLFSIVRHGGVGLGLDFGLDEVRPIPPGELPPALANAQAYALPFSIDLNEERALEGTMWVTRPTPPLHLVAGILRIEGKHPSDPKAMVLELRGARHGLPEEDRLQAFDFE